MRYRRDYSERQLDGSHCWYARWMGGRTLAAVTNCDVRPGGREMGLRYSVEVTGEPDTWFSIPAVTRIGGKRITGYLTYNDGIIHFRPHDMYHDFIFTFAATRKAK